MCKSSAIINNWRDFIQRGHLIRTQRKIESLGESFSGKIVYKCMSMLGSVSLGIVADKYICNCQKQTTPSKGPVTVHYTGPRIYRVSQ